MRKMTPNDDRLHTRRQFVGATVAAGTAALFSAAWPATASSQTPPIDAESSLAFKAAGGRITFDTGTFSGVLQSRDRSIGLSTLIEKRSGTNIAGAHGILSHYRLLDDSARYGHAAWDWASRVRVSADGAAEVLWSADAGHPFDLKAEYRWAAPEVLDVATSVTAQKPLGKFESFLASYFQGLSNSAVYVAACPETDGKPGFISADRSFGHWLAFPRDPAAAKIVQDGRWQRPPNPVGWRIMPRLAAPLAVRRDPDSGLSAAFMASPADCFAVLTPYNGEGHRSTYYSLFGRDLEKGQTETARVRLVVGRETSDERAIELYKQFQKANADTHG